ncbi:unnamed protein product [Protopolystoma xenopodis]|uniref:Uncharacterized protein n=1 Tax=Protopolystoma xenopodis TaxID=117903 RepID=A0A3S5FDQ9_9PLAT|nr:unnamed protein product [Protopolystoma xenopodis]
MPDSSSSSLSIRPANDLAVNSDKLWPMSLVSGSKRIPSPRSKLLNITAPIDISGTPSSVSEVLVGPSLFSSVQLEGKASQEFGDRGGFTRPGADLAWLDANLCRMPASPCLPGRTIVFPGSCLDDPIPIGSGGEDPPEGALCDLFLRLLNLPDPDEPTCRLCAPILYLPSAEW